MKRFSKIIISAFLVVAVAAFCVMMFASATSEDVVYIAANGTGDGSSPESPLGNDPAYYDLLGSASEGDRHSAYTKSAFYLAFQKLSANGGTIVLVGDVVIDSCASRVPTAEGQNRAPSEFLVPQAGGEVVITSVYGGNDYRSAAKLVFDLDMCNTTYLQFKNSVTFEKINIEHKYDPNDLNSWNSPFGISAHGNKLTIGEGVNVTSLDADTNSAGSMFPVILGGDRWENVANTDVTIKSGTWNAVYAGGRGMSGAPGSVTGDASLTIEGGKIGKVSATGSFDESHGTVAGKSTLTVTGGEIEKLYFANQIEYLGSGSVVTIGANADVKFADYALSGYRGNLDDLKSRVTFNIENGLILGVETSTKSDVVYVAANGTGDGSSPESPLGNDPAYYELLGSATESVRNTAYMKNAFYLAFRKLSENGGTIVLVGDVVIDSCESRIPTAEGQRRAPSEFPVPQAGGDVVITSVYGGNDYRSAAKLVFDLDRCNNTYLKFKNPVTFENVNIEHKYDPNDLNAWDTPFTISANGNKFTIGEGVNVTSLDADTNGAGNMFPVILGGDRWENVGNTDVTIKSGTWNAVYAGGRGMSGATAKVTGDAKLTIEGGKISKVSATGSIDESHGTVAGKSTLTVTGGEIERLYFANQIEYLGSGSVVTIGANADVKFADYALSGYSGNLDDLKSRVTFNIENGLILGVEPSREPDVIYVSDKGTGDGSSPESPLGTPSGYTAASQSFLNTAFYKAMGMLKEYGGYIVVVGDTAIDSAESRVEGSNQTPSELTLPKLGGELIVTSVYDGVDYRKNGARLILDHDACSVAFVTFTSDVKFENLDILHKYDLTDTNNWGTPMALAANGNKFVVESTVTVTAWDATKNVEGNWYPMILGGHRYMDIKGNTNVTIKGGTWSAVYAASYGMSTTYKGNVTGNATLNIEGGKVESVYGTTSLDKPYGSIGGKLEINVTGGSVDVIYASAKNGADNEIVINVAATADRVAKIWGGVSEATIPANLTVSYDRSVTRDDEVKYVNPETTIITGSEEDQPEPIYFTLYVANVEKGRGDGSSPENAIGHAPGYEADRAKALAIIAANGGTNSNLSKENSAIVTAVYKKNALYRALTMNGNKIVNQGGVLVICDVLTIDSTDAMRKSFADFWAPAGAETITVTSIHDGVDYRAKGARLVLDASDLGLCVELGSPMVLDHLNIEHRYNSKNGKSIDNGALIAARGNKLTIGYDVYVWANDVNPDEDARVEIFPSICGGHRYADSETDCYVSVGSGTWAAVVGGDWATKHTGNATIGINGGKIGTVCGTSKPTASGAANIFDGSVWIGLWGGEVDNVIVVAKPGMKWGDASIGLGGTKVNGKIRATHADYSGEEIQAWVFNYTDEQIDTEKVIGFESPVPATGSYMGYVVAVAVVSLAGIVLLIGKKRSRNED